MEKKQLLKVGINYINSLASFFCYDVAIAADEEGKERRIDLLCFDILEGWSGYTLLENLEDINNMDFISVCAKNYIIVEAIESEEDIINIPKHLGIYTIGNTGLVLYRKAIKQDFQLTENELLFSLMQGLSREYKEMLRSNFVI